MASPTNWIIGSGALVHVGDVVIGAEGCRARITGVDGKTGKPILTYESGELRGAAMPLHPFHISEKVA